MATDGEKQARLLKVFNIGMYGMIKGMWDLFGDTAFATVRPVGARILTMMEKESGLEIDGENPEDILQEIVRLFADEIGVISDGQVTMDGDTVSMACRECFLREATGWLEDEGVEPFACLPMNIAAAAMQKRLGTKHQLLGRDWDAATETCTIKFALVH